MPPKPTKKRKIKVRPGNKKPPPKGTRGTQDFIPRQKKPPPPKKAPDFWKPEDTPFKK